MKRLNLAQIFDTRRINHSIRNTGLFGYKNLEGPEGIKKAANFVTRQARELVKLVCHAKSNAELSKTVKRVDTISDLLCSVLDAAELLRCVHPDPLFVNAANQACTQLHQFLSELNTDQKLYLALKQAYDSDLRNSMGRNERTVAKLLLKDFEKSGVHMPLEKRKEFIHLNNEILDLGQKFSENAYPAVGSVEFTDIFNSLKGLQVPLLHHLSSGKRNLTIPTNSDIASLILSNAHSEKARKEMFLAMNSASQSQIDTLEKLLIKRGELAQLLGKSSYGHFYMEDKMAASPEKVDQFLKKLVNNNIPRAKGELKQLESLKRVGTVHAWDRYYYAKMIEPPFYSGSPRLALKGELSAYFSIGNVLQGLSDVFYTLYGVYLEPQDTIPGEIWHPDVKKLLVVHETEGILGTIYCDLFKRQDGWQRKYENAAHFTVRCCRRVDDDESFIKDHEFLNSNHFRIVEQNGVKKTYQLPMVVLVTSFATPTTETPCLLDLKEIGTLFHEMGHAMHSMFSQTDFQHISGTRVAMDFVEVPSMFTEAFAKNPEILALIGKHYITGEKISADMIQMYLARQNRIRYLELQDQLQMALLDQIYHSSVVLHPNFNSSEELHNLSASIHPIPLPSSTHWQIQFSHLSTYGASYYAYAWCFEISSRLQKDFIGKPSQEWRQVGEAIRRELLSCGGSRDPWIGLSKLGVEQFE